MKYLDLHLKDLKRTPPKSPGLLGLKKNLRGESRKGESFEGESLEGKSLKRESLEESLKESLK